MKFGKRMLSFLLVLLLVVNLGVTAFAATVNDPIAFTISLDKDTYQVGDYVYATIHQDVDVTGITGYDITVYYDHEMLELQSDLCVNGTQTNGTVKFTPKVDNKNNHLIQLGGIVLGTTFDVPAGDVAVLVFKALKAGTTAPTCLVSFSDTDYNGYTSQDNDNITAPSSFSITIKEATAPAYEGYAVSASEDKTITAGENAEVKVTVSNSDEAVTTYNAYDLTLTYDTDKLTFVSGTAADADASVEEDNGSIRVKGYGADKNVGTAAVTLNFTAKAVGAAEVTIESAKVDKGSSAIENDAPDAKILNATTVITVSGYPVNLGEGLSGASVAAPNEDYTFRATDADDYDYVVTATMGGNAVEVIDNGDGTYTIKNVTGALVISATMTKKPYTVTVLGSGAADAKYVPETVVHGKMVQFLLQKEDGYDYTITVTIGGESYDGMNIDMDGTCTIPGEAVTGNVVITVTKTAHVSEYVTVTKPEWVSGNDTAEKGQNYFFTITKEEGYEYSEPTVTVGGVDITTNVLKDANGTYMIPGDYVTDNMVITVTKTAAITVDAVEYITLNNQSMFLVTASGTFAEGSIAKYDGMSMFWSDAYNAYAYLVISADGLDAVKAAATEKVAVTEGTAAGTVDYTGDVNGTDRIDVNDAQLTYDMYNAKYTDFETVSMLKFLNADVNGDKTVNVNDAAAIIAAIQ